MQVFLIFRQTSNRIKSITFIQIKGSQTFNEKRIGGLLSRYYSNFITAGGSSELLTKVDRRNLCLPENIEAFRNFQPPELYVYQCYHRRFPSYSRDNVPFFRYQPTQHEIDLNQEICRKMEEQKKKDREDAKKNREERKRMINELQNQLAEEEAEQGGDAIVVEEVPEDDVDEVLEENEDLIDELVQDLMGVDPGMDDIVFGLPTRSGRIPKPSARLRNLYE